MWYAESSTAYVTLNFHNLQACCAIRFDSHLWWRGQVLQGFEHSFPSFPVYAAPSGRNWWDHDDDDDDDDDDDHHHHHHHPWFVEVRYPWLDDPVSTTALPGGLSNNSGKTTSRCSWQGSLECLWPHRRGAAVAWDFVFFWIVAEASVFAKPVCGTVERLRERESIFHHIDQASDAN